MLIFALIWFSKYIAAAFCKKFCEKGKAIQIYEKVSVMSDGNDESQQ